MTDSDNAQPKTIGDVYPALRAAWTDRENAPRIYISAREQTEALLDRFLDWATDPKLAVLDTETTGLKEHDQVIEVGVVDANGRTLFEQRVKPTVPISDGAFLTHGILEEDLTDCPSFAAIWPELREVFKTHNVVIYNSKYDLARIRASLAATPTFWRDDFEAQAEVEALGWRVACVMQAYAPIHGVRATRGGWKWAKLAEACTEQKVETRDLKKHAAVSDSLATLRIRRKVAELKADDLLWLLGGEG